MPDMKNGNFIFTDTYTKHKCGGAPKKICMMAEFGYDNELMPTIPFIDHAVEREIWWILKKHGLKPMYNHRMLIGLM